MMKDGDGCWEQNASNKLYSRVVTAMLGEVGIKPGHATLLTILKPGEIRAIQKLRKHL